MVIFEAKFIISLQMKF